MFNGFGTNFEGSPEPLYGSVFLPRKFKVAITVPGDNSVDLFTNDVGIVVMSNDAGEIQGYNIVVGGGMGRTARWVPLHSHSVLSVFHHCNLQSTFDIAAQMRSFCKFRTPPSRSCAGASCTGLQCPQCGQGALHSKTLRSLYRNSTTFAQYICAAG